MTDRFAELKDRAYRRSQVIGAQLQGVESSLLGAIIAILVSAFVSDVLGLAFWMPASLLLIWMLLVYSLIRSIISAVRTVRQVIAANPNQSDQVGSVKGAAGLRRQRSAAGRFLLATSIRNHASLLKAMAALFLVSFISLLALEGVSIWVPLISSALFVLTPILANRAIFLLERSKDKLDFTSIGWGPWLLIRVAACVYASALLVLPIWSFAILWPISPEAVLSDLAKLAAVMLLQWISLVAFMNHFSASLVRKEMSVAMFHLSNIQERVDGLSCDLDRTDDSYQRLRDEYRDATRYNLIGDDSLLIANYYTLRPDPDYLSESDEG